MLKRYYLAAVVTLSGSNLDPCLITLYHHFGDSVIYTVTESDIRILTDIPGLFDDIHDIVDTYYSPDNRTLLNFR